jgi:hypothetical protein
MILADYFYYKEGLIIDKERTFIITGSRTAVDRNGVSLYLCP